ncbi:hypothetical protein [Streptomyces sp. NPDC056264]|uniref:hypothetical protein n=1 Tax=Streptomyces sp. NPDC056264 TaxID=3345767 RepID=UPI003AAE03FD
MVRRKKEKKKRPAWGVPKGIVLLATPEGWRTSVLTESGMLCGRLDVPINTDPQDARVAAAVMVTELARDFHDTEVKVSWDTPRSPGHGPPKSPSPRMPNHLRRTPKADPQAQE